jgi:hypothetical protein
MIFAFENRSYLGKIEAEFKKALARESGAQRVLFDEKKTEGRKSRDTLPLKGAHDNLLLKRRNILISINQIFFA